MMKLLSYLVGLKCLSRQRTDAVQPQMESWNSLVDSQQQGGETGTSGFSKLPFTREESGLWLKISECKSSCCFGACVLNSQVSQAHFFIKSLNASQERGQEQSFVFCRDYSYNQIFPSKILVPVSTHYLAQISPFLQFSPEPIMVSSAEQTQDSSQSERTEDFSPPNSVED